MSSRAPSTPFDEQAESDDLPLEPDDSAAAAPPPSVRAVAHHAFSPQQDRLVLKYIACEDGAAYDQLLGAGLEARDVRERAAELGLTGELVKRIKLSGKRPAMRDCLKCDAWFVSSGPQNRLCSRCQ